MLNLLISLLVVWGFVYTVTDSTIFAPVRIALAARSNILAAFLYCSYCVGFWVGFGFTLDVDALEYPPQSWSNAHELFDAVCGGALVMGATAVVRGFSNGFLFGAWERERDIVERIRERRGSGSGGRERTASADDDGADEDGVVVGDRDDERGDRGTDD